MKNKLEATIIITAEKQERFIERSIKSCLKQSIKKIEIIVIFTKLKNINILRQKYISKNIVFLNVKKKVNNSTQDQLFKIKEGLLIAKGEYIFLLDGDDTFKKNKVKTIVNFLKKKKALFLDNYEHIKNNRKIINKVHSFKETSFYKTVINNWPKGICTSCIALNKDLLNQFFKKIKINKYHYLAIDILLIIYFNAEHKIMKSKKIFTKKYYVKDSVDTAYLGFFNKYYWLRRSEQHAFYSYINKDRKINLDLILTKIINFLIK